MTPDHLTAITRRAAVSKQAHDTGTVGTPPNVDGLSTLDALDLVNMSAEDVPDLLAEVDRLRERHQVQAEHTMALRSEVDRLRAGIEAAVAHPTWHRGMYGSPFDMVRTDTLRALLNRDEGETR